MRRRRRGSRGQGHARRREAQLIAADAVRPAWRRADTRPQTSAGETEGGWRRQGRVTDIAR